MPFRRRLGTPTVKSMICILACASMSWTTGCHVFSKPIVQGPMFDLPMAQPSAPPVVLPVKIKDRRPKWERRYYQGSSDPEQYQKAVTFLAAENFQPSIFERLQTHISTQLAQRPEPPKSAKFELRSFRVVIDRQEMLQAVLEADYQEVEPLVEAKVDSMEELGGALVVGGIIGLVRATPEMITGTGEWLVQQEELLEGPPPKLPNTYDNGITCEIQGCLVTIHRDGSRHREEISAKSRSFIISAGGITKDLPAAVDLAIQNLLSENPKLEVVELESPPGAATSQSLKGYSRRVNQREPSTMSIEFGDDDDDKCQRP